jgi:hypothetical protein
MVGYSSVNLVEHIGKAINFFACAKLKERGVTFMQTTPRSFSGSGKYIDLVIVVVGGAR